MRDKNGRRIEEGNKTESDHIPLKVEIAGSKKKSGRKIVEIKLISAWYVNIKTIKMQYMVVYYISYLSIIRYIYYHLKNYRNIIIPKKFLLSKVPAILE